MGPSPSPGTHVRRGPPPGPAPPPAASPQAASRAALTPCRRCPGRARRSRAARRAGVAATMEPRGGAASQPSQPVSRSGSGSVSRSARSSCRRDVATELGQRAGALAPPAPLRPAPGGARRSGPAPQPMERELSAEGGACRNKGRWGGAVPGLGCWVPRGPDPSERIRGPTRSDPGRPGVKSTWNPLSKPCSSQTWNSSLSDWPALQKGKLRPKERDHLPPTSQSPIHSFIFYSLNKHFRSP